MGEEKEKPENDKDELRRKRLKADMKSGRTYFLSISHEELIEEAIGMRTALLEHYSEKLDLKRKILELEHRLQKYEPKEDDAPDYTGYRRDWPSVKKMQFILQRNYGPLTSMQILREFLSLEPFYTDLWRNPPNCISKILGRACKHKLLERVKIPGALGLFYKIPQVIV